MGHAIEVNFDGLVGPSHHYAGLSRGNVASMRHRHQPSNPRQAALQGLEKARTLHDLGLTQGILPPPARPDLRLLVRLGFGRADSRSAVAALLGEAQRHAPELLAAAWSASSMWTANAATVTPSADAGDGRVHFTPANMVSQMHRGIECADTARLLRRIFAGDAFVHHEPLPAASTLGDEGAANHTRLCAAYGEPGLEIFTFGRFALRDDQPAPQRHPARQTYEASRAIARLHRLDPSRVSLVQQDPTAIDAGVFHNDVIAVGNLDLLLVHEQAWRGGAEAIDTVASRYQQLVGRELRLLRVRAEDLTLDQAVATYLFNSQLVALPPRDAAGNAAEPAGADAQAIVCPLECVEHPRTARLLERFTREGAIGRVIPLDLRQSMQNGGGPACLRLRVVLTAHELAQVHPGVILTGVLYRQLGEWVRRHYRETLSPEDLADVELVRECHEAMCELEGLLGLEGWYSGGVAGEDLIWRG